MPALANSFQSRPIFIKMLQNISSHLLYIKHLPSRTFPPIHLEHIMPLNALYRLPQIPCPPMLMIGLGSPILMENNTFPFPRLLRIMDLPDMPRILRLDRHIIVLRQDNVKIGLIPLLYLFRPEHLHPLPSRTMPPALAPQSLPRPQVSHWQNTFHTHPPVA